MWQYKDFVLPVDASEKAIERALKEEAVEDWKLDRIEPQYGEDKTFKTYILKRPKPPDTPEQKDLESLDLHITGVPLSERFSGPQPPDTYKHEGSV